MGQRYPARRRFVLAASCVAVVMLASAAFADSVTLTGGVITLPWDGSLAGFQLSGPGSQLNGEVLQSPPTSFAAGTHADLSNTVTTSLAGNHAFSELVNGTTYTTVWVDAAFTVTTQLIAIPTAADGAMATFSTPFVLDGHFAAYSDRALTQPVFSVDVRGGGVVSIGPMRFDASSRTWAFAGRGSELFSLTAALPSPWAAADVGAVGIAGVSSYAGGVFYVAGAGADIWGTADAFQFVSQPLTNDGVIVARVVSEQMTSPFAKAGVMLRQSGAASAADVVLDVKPDGGIEFMTRSAGGADTTFLATASTSSTTWLKLTRSKGDVSASMSSDGTTWTALGTARLDGEAVAGLAVTSHDSSVLNQAIFDHVSFASAGAGGALPPSWSQADIGAVGVPGSGSASGGTFTIAGAGADIWGTADAFHYVYTTVAGDSEIDARVVSLQETDAFAKAGVMFRDSLDAGAASVILDVRPNGTIEFMARASSGAPTVFVGGGFQVQLPVSLKLVRETEAAGSLFVASVLDGSTNAWRSVGSVAIPLGAGASAGLAVTSHSTSASTTSVFDRVDVVRDLVVDGGFEEYTPPSLGPPGWVADIPLRAVAAKSETNQPHAGTKNGACWTTTSADCGMYQEITAPADGTYVFSIFASADRSGGFVGVNVNGVPAQSLPVDVRAFGDYGTSPYALTFSAHAGDTIRIWMYSPPTPGYVVVDDATVIQDVQTE